MEEWVKIVIMGIVQGVTEFLPVSSTGHLLVTSAVLNFEGSLGGTFEIFIQVGSVLAVIGFYRRDLWLQVRTVHRDARVQHLWLAIVVAAVPAAVVGLLVRDLIKETIFPQETAPSVVGTVLILGGFVFLVVERRRRRDDAELTQDVYNISFKQALGVGIAQMFALIPGTSRSGASIVGGMLSGMSRQAATAFSFYLAIPVLGGATVIDLLLSLDQIDRDAVFSLLLGTVVTAVVSVFAIGWLLRYISRNDFIPFGYYRIAAGSVLLLLVILQIL
jgi:undecaprenyl-diphosphatase